MFGTLIPNFYFGHSTQALTTKLLPCGVSKDIDFSEEPVILSKSGTIGQ